MQYLVSITHITQASTSSHKNTSEQTKSKVTQSHWIASDTSYSMHIYSCTIYYPSAHFQFYILKCYYIYLTIDAFKRDASSFPPITACFISLAFRTFRNNAKEIVTSGYNTCLNVWVAILFISQVKLWISNLFRNNIIF